MLVLRRVALGGLLLVSLSAISHRARAGGSVGLRYEAPDGCPSQAQFEAAVRDRGGRFDLAPSGVEGSELRVTLRSEGAGFMGSLELQGVAPASGQRQVHAAACEEAMHGIAVITALLLRRAQNEASEEQLLPDAPTPPADARFAPPQTPIAESRLRSVGQFGAESVTVGPGDLTFDNSIAYTLSGGVDVGFIPSLALPRYDLTLSRVNFVTTPSGDRYLISGWLPRARLTMLGGGTYQFGDVSAQLLGFRASFGGCSSLGYDLGGLALLVCGEIAAGIMRVQTRDAAGTKLSSTTTGLGSVGLELDLQYSIGALFHVDLRAGGDFALSEITAERSDGSEVFHSSPFSAHVLGGLGLHF